jgi:hypothetical protein
MRKALIGIGVLLVVVATAAPASATSSLKKGLADQTTAAATISIDIGNRTDLNVHWVSKTDGTHIYETDEPISYYGGKFASSNLVWATATWENPEADRYDSNGNSVSGDLVGDLRWDSYGHRHKTLNSDGTVYAYWKYATLSGSLTWNGESLVDWSSPISARLLRYVNIP